MIYYNLNKKYYYILMSKEIIKITASASKKLSEIASIGNNKNLFFSLKGGGCNGFSYKFKILEEDKKRNKLDEIYDLGEKKLYLCKDSLLFLIGTKIDYIEDIMGSRFDFQNSAIESRCGCGTSFNFDMSKI